MTKVKMLDKILWLDIWLEFICNALRTDLVKNIERAVLCKTEATIIQKIMSKKRLFEVVTELKKLPEKKLLGWNMKPTHL